MLLEKPLLNKQNYVGSYKAKVNSFMQYCDSWLCLIAHNKSSKSSEKILTGYWRT